MTVGVDLARNRVRKEFWRIPLQFHSAAMGEDQRLHSKSLPHFSVKDQHHVRPIHLPRFLTVDRRCRICENAARKMQDAVHLIMDHVILVAALIWTGPSPA